jgi:hypothetical protein
MHMSSRTAKFVSAMFASLLASTPLTTTVSHGAVPPAADQCLSGPKGQTPQGGHWYYRVDRGTKRHCWYLGEERENLSQIAPPISSQPAKPASPKPQAAMQPSIADARAELPVQTRIEPANRAEARAPEMPANAASVEIGRPVPGAETQRSVVASRWPDQSSAIASADPTPDRRDRATSVNSAPRTQPSPVLAAGQFAAADLSSETRTYSVPMQLAALMGALALAGVIGSVVFRFGSPRGPAQARIRKPRGAIWEATDDDRIRLSAHPEADAVPRRPDFTRRSGRAGDRNDRIAEFFSQLSKRAPS